MTVDKLERLPGVYRADTPAPQVVAAVIAKANGNGNGQVEAAELERLLRGWSLDQHDALRGSQRDRADERRRLAGAKERAERSTAEAGGFAGLTDASEALAIGEAAQRVQAAEKFVFMESEPTAFAGGAHYALDKAAAAARSEEDARIRQQEYEEYLYKEQFKGLSAEEALAQGEGVKLGGVVIEDAGLNEKPKRKPPKGVSQAFLERGADSRAVTT